MITAWSCEKSEEIDLVNEPSLGTLYFDIEYNASEISLQPWDWRLINAESTKGIMCKVDIIKDGVVIIEENLIFSTESSTVNFEDIFGVYDEVFNVSSTYRMRVRNYSLFKSGSWVVIHWYDNLIQDII